MIVIHQTRAIGSPAALQFASGALGVSLAYAFVCPAVGAASVGALGDGLRYAGDPASPRWRGAFAAVAALAAGSIAYAFLVPHAVSGWAMLAFALLGMIVNAAVVLAAFPQRLSELHPFPMRASSAAYALLAGSGTAALVWPEGWVCVAAVAAAAPVLAAERLSRTRLPG